MLRTAIDFSGEGFAVIQDGRVELVNRAWARELGYEDPAELIGENQLDRVHPDDRARAAEGPGSRAFEAGAAIEEFLRLRRRDGSYAEFSARVNLASWRGRPALFLMARFAGR